MALQNPKVTRTTAPVLVPDCYGGPDRIKVVMTFTAMAIAFVYSLLSRTALQPCYLCCQLSPRDFHDKADLPALCCAGVAEPCLSIQQNEKWVSGLGLALHHVETAGEIKCAACCQPPRAWHISPALQLQYCSA